MSIRCPVGTRRIRDVVKKRASYSIIVALWLIALLIATGVHAATVAPARQAGLAVLVGPLIRFDPSSSTVTPGAVFVVNVVVDDVADLGGYDFTVAFDPAVVHVQSVALGGFLGSMGRTAAPLGPNIDNAEGSFTFGGFSYGAAPGANGTGTVAEVTLQAMAAGSTALTFTKAQLIDTQAQALEPLSMTPGSVIVSGAARTGTPTVVVTATPTPTQTPPSGRHWVYLPVLRKLMP
jgi:hypothetical protein